MKNPLTSGEWLTLECIDSTQDYAKQQLVKNFQSCPAAIFTWYQTKGRGRFNRSWSNPPHSGLALSLVLKDYLNHQKPWLLGMALAIAAADILKAQLQWPNDILLQGKKLGGILTELIQTQSGDHVPVVGIGVNLNQQHFPLELRERAISLSQSRGGQYNGESIAYQIVQNLEKVPEPHDWKCIKDFWMQYDTTVGKKFSCPGGKILIAENIGNQGELIGKIDGVPSNIMAAEAIFGSI